MTVLLVTKFVSLDELEVCNFLIAFFPGVPGSHRASTRGIQCYWGRVLNYTSRVCQSTLCLLFRSTPRESSSVRHPSSSCGPAPIRTLRMWSVQGAWRPTWPSPTGERAGRSRWSYTGGHSGATEDSQRRSRRNTSRPATSTSLRWTTTAGHLGWELIHRASAKLRLQFGLP